MILNSFSPSVKELLEQERYAFPTLTHFMAYAVDKHVLAKDLNYTPNLLFGLKRQLILNASLLQKIEASPKEVVEGILYECFSSYKGLSDPHTRMQSHSEMIKGLYKQLDTLSAPPCDKADEEDRRASTVLGR